MKVAIVHDWLVCYAGAERVLEQMLKVYPDADLFSLVDFIPDGERGFILDKSVATSFVQKMPWARKKYRHYFPFMPLAVEQFDLSAYDLIISSSHAVAKGVITGPDQLHICICHSPVRYAWDLQHQYLRESGLDKGVKGWLAKWMLHKIRLWDLRTANGVDSFVSVSRFIGRRIHKVYRRDSVTIYPPVNVDAFMAAEGNKEDFYITSSRLVPYKRVDLIVEAFSCKLSDKRLVVIGDGPELQRIRTLAGPNVEFLGYCEFPILKEYLARAKAFIFAAEEDFGIAPLEAQAAGTPVIAYGKGGALETIRGLESDSPSGCFFYSQDIDAIDMAVRNFEEQALRITSANCVENALRFSEARFREEFESFVTSEYRRWIENFGEDFICSVRRENRSS
ncbi:glycosyltransferase family 4 protein [Azotobacter beijerinckii]|uniref:Glycosyltransferase involved in cell wall bisynthesis n=1 Tax=Azotobacter beijerinckii TaxID=170623 RepID=A0A1I3ZVF8_9GAMM|nr:glycosyltransferase family 4 protein [Azotobacter beijerinckii]MDV7209603.1 glycosyltransferase family 4 protein [Azotobacter beijerinckii]SFA85053.1 Glycosyltransferase involved in cell wall bisynthesis [Azotobacter beijerinckii]SFK48048.1 Glycosyltransferase involved in cell wall bisynthesis [Azotobacter beijerinckii]